MSADTVHQMIGRALTDRRFREGLLSNPGEAIRDLPFSRGEREVIGSLRAGSLEEFSRALAEQMRLRETWDETPDASRLRM